MMSDQGYVKEITEDGIIIYRFQSVSRQCIEVWFADVSRVFSDAKAAQTSVHIIYDVRAISSPTPHALKRAHDLAKLPLPSAWYVATLCGPLAANFVNFIRATSLLSTENFARSQVFRSEEEALAWLRSVR
ncbi:MAG: hypothetical protein JXA21_12580 [Anaerolineae bacterium]|nr:hypothetical protein [Anaerolineae bacterium]